MVDRTWYFSGRHAFAYGDKIWGSSSISDTLDLAGGTFVSDLSDPGTGCGDINALQHYRLYSEVVLRYQSSSIL